MTRKQKITKLFADAHAEGRATMTETEFLLAASVAGLVRADIQLAIAAGEVRKGVTGYWLPEAADPGALVVMRAALKPSRTAPSCRYCTNLWLDAGEICPQCGRESTGHAPKVARGVVDNTPTRPVPPSTMAELANGADQADEGPFAWPKGSQDGDLPGGRNLYARARR